MSFTGQITTLKANAASPFNVSVSNPNGPITTINFGVIGTLPSTGSNNAFTGNNSFSGSSTFTGAIIAAGNNSFSGSNLFSGSNSFSGSSTFTGAIIAASFNGIINAAEYTSLTAAIAALPPGGGTVYVPTGTPVTGPVSIPSGVNLIFGTGTFVNQDATGGDDFISFGPGASNASVSGQGIGLTILQNNTSAAQFGTVIKDQGTENTIHDLTADSNNNTTSALLWRQTTRSHCRNVRALQATAVAVTSVVGNGTTATVNMSANILPPNGIKTGQQFRIAGNGQTAFNGQFTAIAGGTTSFTFASNTNSTGTGGYATVAFLESALDVEGGSDHEFTNIEGVGGPNDCFAISTEEYGSDWGSVTGGRYTNIIVSNSPSNGFSLNGLGSIGSPPNGDTISGLVISNIRSYNNGYTGTAAGADDESGITIACNLTHSDATAISDCVFTGINSHGNGGPGLRLKGTVVRCSFQGNCEGNGLRQTTQTDAVMTLIGADNWPNENRFDLVGDKGNGTYIVNEGSGSYQNVFTVASASPSLLGGYSSLRNEAAIVFRGTFTNPTDSRTAFFNQSGVGATVNGLEFQVITGSTPTVALTVNSSQNATFSGNITASSGLITASSLAVTGNVGFFGTTPTTQPTVTGSKGSNAALASLLTALANLGILINSTS